MFSSSDDVTDHAGTPSSEGLAAVPYDERFTDSGFAARALSRATVEAVEYAHAGGWDAAPMLFALAPTSAVEEVYGDFSDDASPLTLIAQDPLLEEVEGGSPELADFLARTMWPSGVVGAVLVQEILVVAPEDEAQLDELPLADLSLTEVRQRSDAGIARQARLITGVLDAGSSDSGPALTLLQPRPTEAQIAERGAFAEDDIDLREANGLADGVIAALRNTFQ